MSYRSLGRESLQRVIDDIGRVTLIEEEIFKKSNDDPKIYKSIIYDVTMDIIDHRPIDKVLSQEKFGWNHEDFSEIIFKQREQDDFIVNPFEVEEGVLTCPKCSKSRTFSYSKQTRSADEPMTTFATCMNCRHKWTYSG